MIKKIIVMMTLLISVVYIVGYLNDFRILNNNNMLKNKINQRMVDQQNVDYHDESVVIRDKIKIDNKLIVLFTFNEDDGVGWLELDQGYNLSYKVERYMYGVKDEMFKMNRTIDTKKGKYLMIIGHNPDYHTIIRFNFEENSYEEILPKKEYFIIHINIPETSDPKSIAQNIKFE